jgi:hypothetical protein
MKSSKKSRPLMNYMDSRSENPALSGRATLLGEPLLEFAYKQRMKDPHHGLALFGPYDMAAGSKPRKIKWGLIATKRGRENCIRWMERIQSGVYPGKNARGEDLDSRLWPVFPGFEAAFASSLLPAPAWFREVDEAKLAETCSNLDSKKRAYDAVEQYFSAVQLTEQKDEDFDVMLCIVPDFVYQNCRPNSVVAGGIGQHVSKREQAVRASGQISFFEYYDPAIYKYSEDFRRQLKARCMPFNIPLQLIRESTITEPRPGMRPTTSPASDVAWNLTTAMYYKSGGKPWKLAAARPGVCYIGVAFRRTDSSTFGRSACCAAQMFLDSGDGIVFLGRTGPWFSPARHQFHLSGGAAYDLLSGILKHYTELEGQPLTEIFLHCRSGISEEEFEGYRAACPVGVKLVGIRVHKETDGVKVFREGAYPVMRGTFWRVSDRSGYLFASGVVPNLGTYPGSEAPVPLRIDVQHGDSNIEQVAKDILGLTKLNYNACKVGDSEPITILFSDRVGEILVSNPAVKQRRTRFKFYI